MNKISADQLGSWVSEERLHRYRKEPVDTVALYMYNAQRSSIVSEVIQHLEVLIRNVIHRQLSEFQVSRRHGIPWYLDGDTYRFTSRMKKVLAEAVRKAGGEGSPPGKVVAELGFGTWQFLLSQQYQTTVWPKVRRGLIGLPDRRQRERGELHNSMRFLNTLRNRVSHSEPIYTMSESLFIRHVSTAVSYVDEQAVLWLKDVWASRLSGCVSPEVVGQNSDLRL